jgi:signal transduction histidine kinase
MRVAPLRASGGLLLIPLLVGLLAPLTPAWAQIGQKRVLVLYSTRRDAQIAVIGERELPRLLEAGHPGVLDYHSEFLDEARFSNAYYQVAFGDFLRVKYRDQRFDLVVAMGDTPLDFIESQRDTVFSDTPVVFFASRPPDRRPANSTGLVASLNLADTVHLATSLQPSVRNVFVVVGSVGAERGFDATARSQLAQFEPRLTINYLSGLPTRHLEARLASLPEHSIVYYLYVDRDGAAENFHPLEYLNRITAAANAPVYCWVDSAMGRGIVGGSLKDQSKQTEAVAALAIRVLRGEPADTIAVATPDLNVRQVDWRQLRRWRISETRVPPGTLLRFREASAWDRYKVYIVGALTLVAAQSLLIAGLLIQRRRRRHAEKRMRDLGARLINAQESERSRIARELHDDVSQQMALLEMDLALLSTAVQDGAQDLADEALERARGVIRSVHDLSHRLHPAKLRLIGLVPAVKGLQRELSSAQMEITFIHEELATPLSFEQSIGLFRVIQEALHNATKYSAARHVSVQLIGEAHAVQVTIVDDGVGFDVDEAWGSGLGLVSMAERVEALGGRLTVRSKRAAGTRIHATVPLPSASEQPSGELAATGSPEARADSA